MAIDQITDLATSSESETLEFKETTGTRREAAMTVCAVRNQRGGEVLFGIRQAEGRVSPKAANAVAVEGGLVGNEHEVA